MSSTNQPKRDTMTTTNGQQTATVETLVAEVRVLMVGSRQITLSVAKQLDVIPLSRLKPFGRVKLGDDDTVIGADTQTGVLCLSRIRPEVDRRAWPALTEHPGWLKPLRCRQHQPAGNGYNGVGSDEVALAFGPDKWLIGLLVDDMEDRHGANARQCHNADCQGAPQCTGFHCTDECNFWDPRDYRDEIARKVEAHTERYREDQRRVQAAKELPLIVLAGLR